MKARRVYWSRTNTHLIVTFETASARCDITVALYFVESAHTRAGAIDRIVFKRDVRIETRRPESNIYIYIRDVPDIRFRFLLAGYPAVFFYPVPAPVPAEMVPGTGYLYRIVLGR